jgi:hypothetical protein
MKYSLVKLLSNIKTLKFSAPQIMCAKIKRGMHLLKHLFQEMRRPMLGQSLEVSFRGTLSMNNEI